MVALAALVEAPTGFVERAAGRYLNRINEGREPWGTSWERQMKTQAAVRRIDEEAAASSRIRAEAETAQGFADLLPLLPDQGGVPITPQKFVQLYKTLPAPIREHLQPSAALSDLYLSGNWQRTSLYRQDDGAVAYLVGPQNKVLAEVAINHNLLDAASWYGRREPGTLSGNPAFAGSIFPSGELFAALSHLDQSIRDRIFLGSDALLELPGEASEVGIANAASGEFVMVGFEVQDERGPVVVTYPADAALMSDLKWSLLSGEADTLLPKLPPDEERRPNGVVIE